MTIASPRGVMALLLTVNLFNYIDRQIVYALFPLIKSDLSLSDGASGSLASAFMIVYMLAAPPIAARAHELGRRFWIVGGVAFWSLATAASALATSYATLFACRAAVGVGEACYGAVSPSFVAERFPPERRGKAMGLFSLAIPVGSALGYIAGGWLGQAFGWRTALCAVGLPGLLLAGLCRLLPSDAPVAPQREGTYREVWAIPTFRLITYAGAAMTFALGGFAVWMPTYLHRTWGLDVAGAGRWFGAVTVCAGICGSLLGGWIADRLRERDETADLLVSAVGLLGGMPLAALAIMAPSLHLSIALLFAAETFLFLNMGPLNAAIVSVTRLEARSVAFAANILVIHALGDAASPTLIGFGSDWFGLSRALLAACAALGLGGMFCLKARTPFSVDAARALRHA